MGELAFRFWFQYKKEWVTKLKPNFSVDPTLRTRELVEKKLVLIPCSKFKPFAIILFGSHLLSSPFSSCFFGFCLLPLPSSFVFFSWFTFVTIIFFLCSFLNSHLLASLSFLCPFHYAYYHLFFWFVLITITLFLCFFPHLCLLSLPFFVLWLAITFCHYLPFHVFMIFACCHHPLILFYLKKFKV